MAFNRFFSVLVYRVILMLITCLAFAFIVLSRQYWFTAFGLIILLILQVYRIIVYLNKSNQYITKYVNYLREENTNFQIPAHYKKPPFDKLIQSLEETGLFVKKAMMQKEYHYHYLQYIINTVGVGLIVFDNTGKVDLVNPKAKRLLNISNITQIKYLNSIFEGFEHLLFSIKPEEDRVQKTIVGSQIHIFSFKATEFKLSDQHFKMVAFQDIMNELDQKELESWQTLIRVLSHELMNTITPVNSLTRSLVNMYRKNEGNLSSEEIAKDTRDGLELISERVTDLLNLVENYKKLSRIPVPNFKQYDIYELTFRIVSLLQPEAREKNINLKLHKFEGDSIIVADEQMISQVLVNIIRNAMEAVLEVDNKNIEINFSKVNDHIEIHITDYGFGINSDEINKIFIPFYTTKEKGSGIGLSLSRQIMRLHKGSVRVVSKPEEFTSFIVSF